MAEKKWPHAGIEEVKGIEFSWNVYFKPLQKKRIPEDIDNAIAEKIMRAFPGRFAWIEHKEDKALTPDNNKSMQATRNK